ncbi:Lipid A export ATP-binding/permease protein MsbA [Paenibacillus pasadenensis]|uniref:Lipid A export ATP-binding/permease protein MsbA n=1 Tax=Paenibacillus pasadenensis TaxID=217090 RepID=A0A2N5N3E5_9BACL|nr:ABC transporter ATP-binding protein [Paenibacillus pasadenensis]PLT44830.1 Lipid A export ATP-binding/permease protein MsbA [Paenibacillus pasadenensis]
MAYGKAGRAGGRRKAVEPTDGERTGGDGAAAALRQRLADGWLRLGADINEARQFQRYELVFTDREAAVIDEQGRLQRRFPKGTIDEIELREGVAGGALVLLTRDGMREGARFTLPHLEAYRIAMPRIAAWLEEPLPVPGGAAPQPPAPGSDAAGASPSAPSGREPHAAPQAGAPQKLPPRVRRGAAQAAAPRGAAVSAEPQGAAEPSRACRVCGKRLWHRRTKCLRCSNKYLMVRRILAYAQPHRRLMIASGVLLLFSIAFELIPTYLMKLLIDNFTEGGSRSALLWLIVAMAAVHLIGTGVSMARSFIGLRFGGRLMGDIRKHAFDAILKLSMSYFDRRQVSQFISRVQNDTEELKQFLTEGFIQFLSQVLLAVGVLGLLFYLNAPLTWMILIPVPFLALGFLWIWPRIRILWYSQWMSVMNVNNVIGESLQGIRVIKAFAQERREKQRFAQANDTLVKRMISMGNLWMSVSPLFSLVIAAFGLLVWYAGGKSVLGGGMTLGSLTAYASYLVMFFGPLQAFGASLNMINRVMGSAERIFELMDAKSDTPDRPDAVQLESAQGEIRFEGVRYGYDKSRAVLKDLNLTIRPGEMIGLVGPSGAGKSTLINLVCRFYDPDAGSIRLDGIDLRDIAQESLRARIGVVLQETFLFDGTIAQNIAYGRKDASPESIIEAARTAGAHGFICGLPEGYETQVGERGHRLSGGEKQRIAIARAVLLDPEILILDEATASVDTETERAIQEALARLVKGRTTIAIAHRLSTLRGADRLIVLEQGRIAETGTHDELYRSKGTYWRLVESQKQMTESEVG